MISGVSEVSGVNRAATPWTIPR